MDELLNELSSSDFAPSAGKIYEILKPQIQKKGILANIKDEVFNEKRKNDLEHLEEDFLNRRSCDDLDERINELSSAMYQINKDVNDQFKFDPIMLMTNFSSWKPEWRELKLCLDKLNEAESEFQLMQRRLANIICSLVIESVSQSNKAQAGIAGEALANAIFASAGLIENKHYKRQHISEVGSPTDYVMPYVPDNVDDDVEIYLAVQYSSNDRARMINSELKKSANQFFITGNGLDGSTKNLKDIGKAIIASHAENKFRLVCYGPEIELEKRRLEKEISKKNKNMDENERKLANISRALSYEQFARNLNKRFVR